MKTSAYKGTLVAPYRSFKPMGFWSSVFPGGTYTANLQGCPWTCANCWSKSGWRESPAKFDLMPDEVAAKIVKGMQRNAQTAGRITGGEPAMYWDHTRGVIDAFIARTEGMRIHVPGATGRRGDPAGLVIETNGAVQMTPSRLQELEDDLGEEAGRIVIHLGIKATSGPQLAQLTGMTAATCARFHQQQLDNLLHAAYKLKHLVVHASFLDEFTDPAILSAIQREVERGRPGMSRNVGVLDFNPYRAPLRAYVPPVVRADFRDDPGAEDDETLHALLPRDAEQRYRIERNEADPVDEPQDRGELADDAIELGEAFEREAGPAGRLSA